jgi:hypothetical protein
MFDLSFGQHDPLLVLCFQMRFVRSERRGAIVQRAMSANRKRLPPRRRSRLVIAISIAAMAVFAGVYAPRLTVHNHAASNVVSEPSAMASISDGQRQTTIIVSAPNGNDCRRYQLNVTTGVRSDEQGPINCADEVGNQPGQMEAISKAFRNR